MNKRYACPVSILLLTTLAGCGHAGGGDPSTIQLANPGPTVETVNGEAVPQRLLDALAHTRNWDISNPKLRDRALADLTNTVLAVQASRDAKVAGDTDLAALAELGRLQAISGAAVTALQTQGEVDDAALQAEYDKQTARANATTYDFSHIVFAKDKEADAVKAAAEAAGGKPFTAVMEAHKKDAVQTHVFTHVRAAQLPPPLGAAIAAMKPGETLKAPVQTQLGWHVVHLDAATPSTPPAFDQVKESLRRSLLKRAAEDRMMKLRAEAKIDPPLKAPEPLPPMASRPLQAPFAPPMGTPTDAKPADVKPVDAKPADDSKKKG
jgi:peptidyl-prolyl cis-trans isomerase C